MMSSTEYVPQRGDVIWINFNPQAGHEQAGRRPAVVLSPGTYTARPVWRFSVQLPIK